MYVQTVREVTLRYVLFVDLPLTKNAGKAIRTLNAGEGQKLFDNGDFLLFREIDGGGE